MTSGVDAGQSQDLEIGVPELAAEHSVVQPVL